MWSLTHDALRRPIKVGRTCSNDDVCSTMYYILYPGALRFTLRPICLVHFATVPFDCVINMFHCITLTCILLIINRAVGKQSAVTVLVSVGKYFVIVRFRNQKPGAALRGTRGAFSSPPAKLCTHRGIWVLFIGDRTDRDTRNEKLPSFHHLYL